jgi:ketosteroid isomerase-like protein
MAGRDEEITGRLRGSNADVVRAVLEAQRRRDWDAFPRLYDRDIEWEDVSGLWGDWGTRHGFDDVRDAWITWFEAFEQVEFEIENMIETGDEVVALLRISGRGRESGLLVEQRMPSVWTVQRGKIVRVRGYRNEAEALKAAGLPE